MLRLGTVDPLFESNQENATSSGVKNVEVPTSLEQQQKQDEHDRTVVQNLLHDTTQVSVASLSVHQLQHMIADTIRAQYGGAPQSSLVYAKPYSLRIDEMRMPLGYQPPKFQQFDGKGNPKQHVAHFIETCNNAGTYGDLMVKQFVRSLKGAAFEWYTDLQAGSIDSWDQLEREFLSRFYSTRRTVSLPELARTKQRKEEPVEEYIERWRNLVLNCKEKISETSSIDMCVQGMHWGLLYNLQANMPHSFEELATRAHDLEIQIERHGSYLPNEKKDIKKENKRDGKSGKGKESMAISTPPAKISFQRSKSNFKNVSESKPSNGQNQRKSKNTLKELEEKEYPFLDSEVSGIFDQLIEQSLITLPTPKRPEEVGRTDHPKYCKFHRIISHPIKKCFVLKDLIVRLSDENKIKLDPCEDMKTSCGMITSEFFDSMPVHGKEILPEFNIPGTSSSTEPKEIGPQLPEGAVLVQFTCNGESTYKYAYSNMPRDGNLPTLYELMTDDLELWISSSESEDEIGDGWSTFISKKKKYKNSKKKNKKKMTSSSSPDEWLKIQPSGWSSPDDALTECLDADQEECLASFAVTVEEDQEEGESLNLKNVIDDGIKNDLLIMKLSEMLSLPLNTRLALVQMLIDPQSSKEI